MEKVKLDNRRILFNLLPAHVAQHFLMSNPRNMVSLANRQADRQTDKQVHSAGLVITAAVVAVRTVEQP